MHAAGVFLAPDAGAGAGVDLRKLAIGGEHQQDGVLGDRDAVAGMQPRHADPLLAADIEIDAVDAGAELLDELKPLGLGQ